MSQAAAAEEPPFTVVRGNPTPDELAAVTAVLAAKLAEESADAETARRVRRSAWELSQRPVRSPLDRQPGWHRTSL